MLKVLMDYSRRDFAPHTSDKLATVPQLLTLQLLFYLWKLLKKQPRGSALQTLHNLGRSVSWWRQQKNMHVFLRDFLGVDLKVIPLHYPLKNLLQPVS